MRLEDYVRLIVLGGIWGSSFIFMKILSPVIGPFFTTGLRVSIAGIALLIYFRFISFRVQWLRHWKHYVIMGVVNSALPFLLYAFAALHNPASVSAILNSTTPLFGAIFAALWLNEPLTLRRILGLFLGCVGVSVVVLNKNLETINYHIPSILCCLGATTCYALSGIYLKKFAKSAPPLGLAGASQIVAGITLMPLALIYSPSSISWNFSLLPAILSISLLCSAAAFILYYRLMQDVGPTNTMTVAFLMPMFSLLWGTFFLNEIITLNMGLGCILILLGTALVLPIRLRTTVQS